MFVRCSLKWMNQKAIDGGNKTPKYNWKKNWFSGIQPNGLIPTKASSLFNLIATRGNEDDKGVGGQAKKKFACDTLNHLPKKITTDLCDIPSWWIGGGGSLVNIEWFGSALFQQWVGLTPLGCIMLVSKL